MSALLIFIDPLYVNRRASIPISYLPEKVI
jgi:hypothetical protein